MTVLLVTGAYAPEISSGGLQAQMVAHALAGRVQFRVLTTATDAALPRESVVDGVAVVRVFVDAASRRSKSGAAPRMAFDLFRLIRTSDVLHLHGYSQKNVLATTIAKAAGVPIVMSLHTAGFDEPQAIARHGAAARWAFAAPNLYLAVSPALVDACRAAGIEPDRVRRVVNGVDLERFRPASDDEKQALRRRVNIPDSRPMLLFVGFFSRDKQPDVLFNAWLRLQAAGAPLPTLVFVGATSSPYFEVDRALADSMTEQARQAGVGDRLVFVPPTPRVEDYYRGADLFALPSAREGMPVALLEAMACGLPAVASRLAGATDAIVDDGRTGVLVPPGDAVALADAIQSLLANPARAAGLGAAARRHVAEEFGAERVAREWLDAYLHVAGQAA